MNDIHVTRKCKTCSESFDITSKEAQWLLSKQLELFTHCPDCRKKRKEAKKGEV